jgi:antitoxin VapB
MPSKTARLFTNGGSQAVRLPAEFRFEGEEVFVRRDERTGDVILSKKAGWNTWTEYLALRDRSSVPADFMADRPMNEPLSERQLWRNER